MHSIIVKIKTTSHEQSLKWSREMVRLAFVQLPSKGVVSRLVVWR